MSIKVSNNRLVTHFLNKVRDKNSDNIVFGNSLKKITLSLALDANEDFAIKDTTIESPFVEIKSQKLAKPITIVPILRSGLIMSDALQFFFEDSRVVHLGIYRDTNLNAISYYEKFPEKLENTKIILCDPLIATAVTISKALDILSKYNCKDITILGIIISQHAVNLLNEKYPDLNIYVAAIDPELNSKGYIIPGAGDAGDRLFKTK